MRYAFVAAHTSFIGGIKKWLNYFFVFFIKDGNDVSYGGNSLNSLIQLRNKRVTLYFIPVSRIVIAREKLNLLL